MIRLLCWCFRRSEKDDEIESTHDYTSWLGDYKEGEKEDIEEEDLSQQMERGSKGRKGCSKRDTDSYWEETEDQTTDASSHKRGKKKSKQDFDDYDDDETTDASSHKRGKKKSKRDTDSYWEEETEDQTTDASSRKRGKKKSKKDFDNYDEDETTDASSHKRGKKKSKRDTDSYWEETEDQTTDASSRKRGKKKSKQDFDDYDEDESKFDDYDDDDSKYDDYDDDNSKYDDYSKSDDSRKSSMKKKRNSKQGFDMDSEDSETRHKHKGKSDDYSISDDSRKSSTKKKRNSKQGFDDSGSEDSETRHKHKGKSKKKTSYRRFDSESDESPSRRPRKSKERKKNQDQYESDSDNEDSVTKHHITVEESVRQARTILKSVKTSKQGDVNVEVQEVMNQEIMILIAQLKEQRDASERMLLEGEQEASKLRLEKEADQGRIIELETRKLETEHRLEEINHEAKMAQASAIVEEVSRESENVFVPTDSELEKVRKEREEMSKMIQKLEKARREMGDQLQQAQEEAKALRTEKEETAKELTELKNEREQLRRKMLHIEETRGDIGERLQDAEEETNQLKAEKKAKTKEIREIRGSAHTRSTLQQAESERKDISQNLKKITEEREQMVSMVNQLDSSRRRIQGLIEGTLVDYDDNSDDDDMSFDKSDRVGNASRSDFSDAESLQDKMDTLRIFSRTPTRKAKPALNFIKPPRPPSAQSMSAMDYDHQQQTLSRMSQFSHQQPMSRRSQDHSDDDTTSFDVADHAGDASRSGFSDVSSSENQMDTLSVYSRTPTRKGKPSHSYMVNPRTPSAQSMSAMDYDHQQQRLSRMAQFSSQSMSAMDLVYQQQPTSRRPQGDDIESGDVSWLARSIRRNSFRGLEDEGGATQVQEVRSAGWLAQNIRRQSSHDLSGSHASEIGSVASSSRRDPSEHSRSIPNVIPYQGSHNRRSKREQARESERRLRYKTKKSRSGGSLVDDGLC